MNDTRALAAQVLAAATFDGSSMREALLPAQAQLADARDRALLTAIANEGARWWLRFDGGGERVEALLEAVLVELPLAALCGWIVWDTERFLVLRRRR